MEYMHDRVQVGYGIKLVLIVDCRRIRDMQPSSSNKIKRRAHAQLKALVRSYRLTFTARHPRRRREDGGGHDHGAAGGHQGRHGSLRMMCRCRSSLCFGTSNRDQQTRKRAKHRMRVASHEWRERRHKQKHTEKRNDGRRSRRRGQAGNDGRRNRRRDQAGAFSRFIIAGTSQLFEVLSGLVPLHRRTYRVPLRYTNNGFGESKIYGVNDRRVGCCLAVA